MPKALFYTPYLDSLGGGERYTLTLAHALKEQSWQISVLWDNPDIAKDIEAKFGFQFSDTDFHSNIFQSSSPLRRSLQLREYHLCFYLSDGSVPLLTAKKNLLHFQIPFQNIHGQSLANQLKLKNIHHVVCNSQFTKKFIDREFKVNSQVIYPPVDTTQFKPGKKQNLILYVGRFSKLLQAKNHALLIQEFAKLSSLAGLKNWRLVLAGGAGVGTDTLVSELKNQAQNYPIDILPNPDFQLLKKLYSQAKIFWSASGYDINPDKEPEKCEHFGITVVEAMASGAVPIIVNLGGHPEIVQHRKSGFLWKDLKDLHSYTLNLIHNQPSLTKLSQSAQQRAKVFSTQNFINNYLSTISS